MELLDPNVRENYDEVQMRRIALAASLCTTRRARLRPRMREASTSHILPFEYCQFHFLCSSSWCLVTDTEPSERGRGNRGMDRLPHQCYLEQAGLPGWWSFSIFERRVAYRHGIAWCWWRWCITQQLWPEQPWFSGRVPERSVEPFLKLWLANSFILLSSNLYSSGSWNWLHSAKAIKNGGSFRIGETIEREIH